MQIELIKYLLAKDSAVYKYKPLQCCCKKLEHDMHTAISDEYILEGEDLVDTSFEDTDGIQIPHMCLMSNCELDEDFWNTVYSPIKFCPYCGEEIKLKMLPVRDVKDKVADLENKIEEKKRLYRASDSVRERDTLNQEIIQLRNELDNYWNISISKE